MAEHSRWRGESDQRKDMADVGTHTNAEMDRQDLNQTVPSCVILTFSCWPVDP